MYRARKAVLPRHRFRAPTALQRAVTNDELRFDLQLAAVASMTPTWACEASTARRPTARGGDRNPRRCRVERFGAHGIGERHSVVHGATGLHARRAVGTIRTTSSPCVERITGRSTVGR